MLKTKNHEPISAEMPQTHLLSQLKRYFSFMEISSKTLEMSCSVLIKNITMHKATLPTGILGYIEILLATERPSHYRVIYSNTLVQSVVHLYHSEITEPINVLNRDIKPINNNSFEINHIDQYKNPLLNINVCKVQKSEKLAPPLFPPLPYSKEKLQFLKKNSISLL